MTALVHVKGQPLFLTIAPDLACGRDLQQSPGMGCHPQVALTILRQPRDFDWAILHNLLKAR